MRGSFSGGLVRRFVLVFLVIAPLSGCAGMMMPDDIDPEQLAAYKQLKKEFNDPLEPMNRVTFAFNQGVEKVFLRPAAKVYRTVLPDPLRGSIRNALNNLGEPVTFTNDLLQGEGKRAGIALGRFVINSTLGIGGLFDPATHLGLAYHKEDFGQTLGVWGVGEGFYLVLPLLGPSNGRDAVGRIGTIAMDPFFWLLTDSDVAYLRFVRRSISGIDTLSRNLEKLDALKRASLDYYSAVRFAYRQSRRSAIANGEIEPEVPDFLLEELDEEEDEALDELLEQGTPTEQPSAGPSGRIALRSGVDVLVGFALDVSPLIVVTPVQQAGQYDQGADQRQRDRYGEKLAHARGAPVAGYGQAAERADGGQR